jgi:hypothetical protein
MKRGVILSVVRGAFGFTAGAAMAVALGARWLGTAGAHTVAAVPPNGAGALALVGFLLSGAVGAVAVTLGKVPTRVVIRAALFFSAGIAIAFAAAFIASSIGFNHQTMRSDYAWTVAGFAAAYAAGGAVGGSALGSRQAFLAALSFGIAGALGGTLVALSSNHFPAGQLALIGAVFVPNAVGGALFGAFIAARPSRPN